MTAPIVDEFACTAHPEGSVQECGPCATVRRRQKAWMQRYDTPMRGAAYVSPRGRDGRAENHYEQALQEYNLRNRNARPLLTDSISAEEAVYLSALDAWGDKHVTVPRRVRDGRLSVTLKHDEEGLRRRPVVDLSGRGADVAQPEVIGLVGGEVKNGSVVVQLDSHGRKRIARRILAAAAFAAVALWAVAS